MNDKNRKKFRSSGSDEYDELYNVRREETRADSITKAAAVIF